MWNKVLSILEGEINRQSFNMWLKDTHPVSFDSNNIKVKVIDEVARKHISEQYINKIEEALEKISGQKYLCELVTENGFDKDNSPVSNQASSNQNIFQKSFAKPASDIQRGTILNPNYTFANFVIGPNNQFAHAAAYSVAQQPGRQINPLFIYGNSGLGKTHLLQAIGNYISEHKPYLKILFVTTEQFINEFINSILTRTQASFKIKYREVDVLLIDDIQFLEGKEENQAEFFHTFNELHKNQKQIVISCDRPPKQIANLTDRLRTRFQGGMITDVQTPNLETREAILRNKAEMVNIDITEDAYNYIARRIKSNIRSLEAAVNRLKLVSTFHSEPITIEHCKLHLKELFDVDAAKKVTITDIMERVGARYNVTPEELKSNSRHSRIVLPRFTSMYLARKLTELTTSDIGREFGDRDHSTVVNAVNKIEDLLKKDYEFKELLDDITVELKS